MEIPAFLYEQAGEDVAVEPYLGAGPFGDTHGPPVTVRAIVDDKRRLVRNGKGDQVVSETTIRCPLATDDHWDPEAGVEDSKVTVRGRARVVVAHTRHDGHALPVPSHVEVALA